MNIFTFILVLLPVCYCQRLINLSSLKGNGWKNTYGLIAPYGVYVSASTDDQDLLSKIFLVDNEVTYISLDQLRSQKLSKFTGELQPYPCTTFCYLTTNVTMDVLQNLNGVVFYSSTNQFENTDFHVVDVSTVQYFNTIGTIGLTKTTFFLNTQAIKDREVYPTVISNWNQDENGQVLFYNGLPLDYQEPTDTQIFSNPVNLNNSSQFFKSVEKFSLWGPFYIKSTGGIQLRFEPGLYDPQNVTSSYTTTGLVSLTGDSSFTYNTLKNQNYSGWTGGNVIGSVLEGASLNVRSFDEGNNLYQPVIEIKNTISSWSYSFIGDGVEITSNGTGGGQWFYQYFVIQGAEIIPPSTSTSQKPTTTQVSTASSESPSTTTKIPISSTKTNSVTSTVTPEATTGALVTNAKTTSNLETTTKSSNKFRISVFLVISICLFS